MQFVLQHCWKASWKALLRILPATFKPVKDLICGKTGLNLGVKNRNIAIQLVCNNAIRHFAWFLLSVYPYLKQDHGLEGPAARSWFSTDIFSVANLAN